MKQTTYRWYRIFGKSYGDEGQTEIDTTFIFLVQSANPRNVVKHYGGRRKCLDHRRNWVHADFPRNPKAVELLPQDWDPNKMGDTELYMTHERLVIKVIPVSIYPCTCGQVHHSDFPYPSMWCSCGQKAYRDQGNDSVHRNMEVTATTLE